MSECVGVDMRQSIVPAEVIQPSGNAVRMEPFPVIFGEYHSGFFPVRPLLETHPHLLQLPLFYKFHALRSEFQRANLAGFGRAKVNAGFLCVLKETRRM